MELRDNITLVSSVHFLPNSPGYNTSDYMTKEAIPGTLTLYVFDIMCYYLPIYVYVYIHVIYIRVCLQNNHSLSCPINMKCAPI